jgi:hypothetical protein
MKNDKLIALSIAAVVSAVAAVFAFIALSASGNGGPQPFDGMMMEMMGGGMMQMQPPKDVLIELESDWKVPAGKQSEVVLKVLDKQTNETMQGGAEVIIGIEKGLPMKTMDMMGNGMFNAEERGNGTYAFTFTPESEGYYTIHVHVIPSGEQMHSMMENHADLVMMSE